ncbi:hypothetical protein JY97_00980 [Alkalispirochaeta odontotermitis]|nr:hypothetical protein JY97_00980 [Alkalispirochaeta odontotermitis]CAB1075344.1 hypothetical protein D1AOALGA4SA_3164 [Olavius algarvensis Delta 1 endosymbiont]
MTAIYLLPVIVLIVLLVLEALACLMVRWLRKDFQWLITPQDLHPRLDEAKVRRFFEHGADPELGWVRKPNTGGTKKGSSASGITYIINGEGARKNPGFEHLSPVLLAVGDSYTFGRQVSDNQTWPHFVSRELNVNTLNFGVGNYGLDQALLFVKRQLPGKDVKVVIFGVVPETICRVQSYWKHYCEYGNTFAFKPRYTLNGSGRLALQLNPVNTVERFMDYRRYLPHINSMDRFYREKFLKDMLRFPYLYHLIRSAKRNVPLIAMLLHGKMSSDPRINKRPFRKVLERNHRISARLYRDKASLDLMEALVTEGARFVRVNGAQPVLCILPQLQDIQIMRNKGVFYETFLERIRNVADVIDLGPHILELPSTKEYYTDDMWGGHPSVKANQLIGSVVSDAVRHLL